VAPYVIASARAETGIIDALERGEISSSDVHAWFEERFAVRVDAAEFDRAFSDIFWTNESMLPVLDTLRACGHRLVLLSNTNSLHVRWIRGRCDVLDRFDHLVLSHEVGAMKPDERIFAAALRHIDCAPAECLYTDDVERYVVAAHGHGLDAVVFTTTSQFVADVESRGVAVGRVR
jgi:putative hydrolase of the HAD superfamily